MDCLNVIGSAVVDALQKVTESQRDVSLSSEHDLLAVHPMLRVGETYVVPDARTMVLLRVDLGGGNLGEVVGEQEGSTHYPGRNPYVVRQEDPQVVTFA